VHEVCASANDGLYFLAETREIGRQNTRCNAKCHHFSREPAHCNWSLWITRARAVLALAWPRPPHDAEQQQQRDAGFEQQPEEFHGKSDGILTGNDEGTSDENPFDALAHMRSCTRSSDRRMYFTITYHSGAGSNSTHVRHYTRAQSTGCSFGIDSEANAHSTRSCCGGDRCSVPCVELGRYAGLA
jgi:hypothetical protein